MKLFQVLGNSDIHNSPNVITLDHCLKHSRVNSYVGPANGLEIHIHLGDALQFGGSVLDNSKNTNTTESTLRSSPGMKIISSNWISLNNGAVLSVMIFPKKDTVMSCDFEHALISNCCSTQLSNILSALKKSQPGSNFTGMLTPLQEAGVHTLDKALLHGEALLVEWTGLPLHQVVALCNYSET